MEDQLEQVINHIVANALKFTREGGTVSISATRSQAASLSAYKAVSYDGMLSNRPMLGSFSPTDDSIAFDISDTGIGISDAEQDNLFRPFTHINAGKEKAHSTGLGLVISHKIINRMKGQIGFRTQLGKGSSFMVLLPPENLVGGWSDNEAMGTDSKKGSDLKIISKHPQSPKLPDDLSPLSQCEAVKEANKDADSGDSKASSTILERKNPKEDPAEKVRPLRVLLVDDVLPNRKLLGRLLSRYIHCECAFASDGSVAVDMVALAKKESRSPYDVILMDNKMPIMSGTDASQRIMDNDFQGIIIGVTGDAFEEDQRKMLKAGVETIFTKPVNTKELISYLGKRFPFLKRKKREQRSLSMPLKR